MSIQPDLLISNVFAICPSRTPSENEHVSKQACSPRKPVGEYWTRFVWKWVYPKNSTRWSYSHTLSYIKLYKTDVNGAILWYQHPIKMGIAPSCRRDESAECQKMTPRGFLGGRSLYSSLDWRRKKGLLMYEHVEFLETYFIDLYWVKVTLLLLQLNPTVIWYAHMNHSHCHLLQS